MQTHDQGAHTPQRQVRREEIRSLALGAALGALVCFYFGSGWMIDAPGSATEEAAQTWFLVDHVFRWVLTVLGVLFAILAVASWLGAWVAAPIGVVVEGGFALTMFAMAIDTFLEARADGGFDAFNMALLVILGLIGIGAARQSWRLWMPQRAVPFGGDEESHTPE